jgi:hypothetical protein
MTTISLRKKKKSTCGSNTQIAVFWWCCEKEQHLLEWGNLNCR